MLQFRPFVKALVLRQATAGNHPLGQLPVILWSLDLQEKAQDHERHLLVSSDERAYDAAAANR